MLFFEDGEPFASAATRYEYRPVTESEVTPRIIVPIVLNNSFPTLAFVDTGGIYGICSPEIAEALNIDPKDGVILKQLRWRRYEYDGTLHRIPITIEAEEGYSFQFEATFFIPQLNPNDVWVLGTGCILGMYYCLERIRFAVDPGTDTFYFGELT